MLSSTSVVSFADAGRLSFRIMNLGRRVKYARERRGLTQDELAYKVTGSHDPRGQAAISALETRDSVRSKFAPKIAQVLSVDLHWLTSGEGVSGLDHPPKAQPEDKMLEQLINLWGQLSPDGRHTVLNHANYVHAQEHPNASPSNPFGKSRSRQDAPSTAKRG